MAIVYIMYIYIRTILLLLTGNTVRYNTGDIRLTGSTLHGDQGLVEMFFAGQWHLVCDDQITDNSALVICKKLGYKRVNNWRNVQDTNKRRLALRGLDCDGTEEDLLDCAHNGPFLQSCSNDYAYVVCK